MHKVSLNDIWSANIPTVPTFYTQSITLFLANITMFLIKYNFSLCFISVSITAQTFQLTPQGRSELTLETKGSMMVRDTEPIRQWALRQLADYDSRQPGTLFAEGVVLDVARAYEIQSAVAQLRCERGERVVGYKVGCTSPTIRAQLGIDHCVTGRLYDSEQHAAGTELPRSRFASLAIEGELAVELSREPHDTDFLMSGVPSCIARVFPVIELHNHVMRGEHPSAGELIANNAIHAGFVAGPGIRSHLIPNDEWDSAALSIFADDRLLDECAGTTLIQTIHSSLQWLIAAVHDRGDRLSAGQFILTGSIPSLIPITENCRIRVDAPPFGSVDVMFTT